MQVPSEVTTTFVGKVPSKASLALKFFVGISLSYMSYAYMVTHQSYHLGDQDERREDLLYMRISGFQRLEGGTRMSFTPPYSASSHRMLLSVHSCATIALNITAEDTWSTLTVATVHLLLQYNSFV